MRVDVRLDTRGLDGFTRDLARVCGRTHEDILPLVCGRVLSTCVKYTKKASPKKSADKARAFTEKDHNTFGGGNPQSRGARDATPYISITRNGVWWVDRGATGARTFYKMDDPRMRWGDARHSAYRAQETQRVQSLKTRVKTAVKEARESAGLSAKAWADVGALLGVEVKVSPGYVKKAKPSTGRTYPNAIARKGTQGGTHYIDIGTSMPVLVEHIDGAGILTRAIGATKTAFDGDLRRGVFRDAQQLARRWPGFSVRP